MKRRLLAVLVFVVLVRVMSAGEPPKTVGNVARKPQPAPPASAAEARPAEATPVAAAGPAKVLSGRKQLESLLQSPANLDFGRKQVTLGEVLDRLHEQHHLSIRFDTPTLTSMLGGGASSSPSFAPGATASLLGTMIGIPACIGNRCATGPEILIGYGPGYAPADGANCPQAVLQNAIVTGGGIGLAQVAGISAEQIPGEPPTYQPGQASPPATAVPAPARPAAPPVRPVPQPRPATPAAVPSSSSSPQPVAPSSIGSPQPPVSVNADVPQPSSPSSPENPEGQTPPAAEPSAPVAKPSEPKNILADAREIPIDLQNLDVAHVSIATVLRHALDAAPTADLADMGGMPILFTQATLLDYLIEDDGILITTRMKTLTTKETRVYSVRNLGGLSPEEIAKTIRQSVRPWSWRSQINDLGDQLKGSPLPPQALTSILQTGAQLAGAEVGISVTPPSDNPEAPAANKPSAIDEARQMEMLGNAVVNGLVTLAQATLSALEMVHYAEPPTGTIQTLGARLVITQSQTAHREIAELLRQLEEE